MALTDPSMAALTAFPPTECASNDAFSFWKLPNNWQPALEASIAASRAVAEWYLFERYLPERRRRPPPELRAYYAVKRVIPEWLRHRGNSMFIRVRHRRGFPNWPRETALMSLWREWLQQSLKTLGVNDCWHIGFWPEGKKCCIVLTHDVESTFGVEHMEQMAAIEERWGFRSAWNLPLAQYEVDWRRIERLRARGFEIGAHGLSHDGKLFRSHKDFLTLSAELERLARERHLVGFRSPSTLRCAEWIQTMNFDFDSSFSDTDPYEPQPGGTCSIFPFFLNQMIELPYTLPQDHTLIHILGRDPLPLWRDKLRWIASQGGMILSLIHPDYCGVPPWLEAYEQLVRELAMLDSSWRALPSEVADWWRRRARLSLVMEGDQPRILGPATEGACVKLVGDEPLARGEEE